MSGILNEAFTPCPFKSRFSGWSGNGTTESFDSYVDNDDSALDATAQIEFTAEVRAPTLTGVRPRRSNRASNPLPIYEDKQYSLAEKRKRPNTGPRSPSKSSLLAHPAQRFRPQVNFAPSPKSETRTRPKIQSLKPRATGGSLSALRTADTILKDHGNGNNSKDKAQRNIVYIPPDDDTSVASSFMGLFSPLQERPGTTPSQVAEDTRNNTLEARIAKRQARKSTVVPARRAPLQPSTKIAQEATFRMDVAGKNGGKENIPPGTFCENDKRSKLNHAVQSKPKRLSTVMAKPPHCTKTHQPSKIQATDAVVGVPKQLTKRNVLGEKQINAYGSSVQLPLKTKSRTESEDPLRNASASLKARASLLSERLGHSQSVRDSKIGKPTLKELNNEYPLLTEDISKPALYEDDWLSHQETVITQLVNALFECDSRDSIVDPNALRLEMLELYHTENFTRMYQRLQSSLSYGTLTIPRDIQSHNNRLQHDVGLRRDFCDTWTRSYDLRTLVPALETVVGRSISSDSTLFDFQSHSSFTNNFKFQRAVCRKVESFLEAFLLRNDDIMHHAPRLGDVPKEIHERAYRRTVLRSIVLVVLLDYARQSSSIGLPQRLFLPSSPYKSSAEVLQALARLLLPSGGDLIRTLSHLGCQINYKQHQLQEFEYVIENIAVDLRDGVRLTRLTELTLSSREALSLGGNNTDLPLSKHLRYPCTSRAAKIHNVRIALSALRSVNGGHAIVGDIRAEDIVEGYREKTITLLWALVSRWGLDGHVDWEDVRKEIGRLQRKAIVNLGRYQSAQKVWSPQKELINDHALLLQRWATVLAALKGLDIHNMTTSFADGKIYGSIIDEYEPFITGSGKGDSAVANWRSVSMSLESRLRLLGCSSQFASLISPGETFPHLLDEKFTLGTLVFLCSRLLSASKRARAAVVLQRAWRAHLAQRDESRRKIAHDLAAHCAAVVQTRNEIIWATDVITRYWSKYQMRKQRTHKTRCRALEKAESHQRKTVGHRL